MVNARTAGGFGFGGSAAKEKAPPSGAVECEYVSPNFVTNPDKMRVELEDPYILIYEKKLTGPQAMLPVLESIVQTGKAKGPASATAAAVKKPVSASDILALYAN